MEDWAEIKKTYGTVILFSGYKTILLAIKNNLLRQFSR